MPADPPSRFALRRGKLRLSPADCRLSLPTADCPCRL